MQTFRGIIALDIDGTITLDPHLLDPTTLGYLNRLIAEQWCVVFISGRTFSFARPILSGLIGIYYFSVQNGAALYEMPNLKQLKRDYLPGSAIAVLEKAFKGEPFGLLIEAGQEREDICYYKPQDFNENERSYLEYRISVSPGLWVPVNSFAELDLHHFACGKFFSSQEGAEAIAQRIPYRVTTIKDPFRPAHYLAHINSIEASKGRALQELMDRYPQLPVIVAGDDANDLPMLKLADVKIVMSNAPPQMHALADILAPPVHSQGIITALQEAIDDWLPRLR